MIRSMTGYGQGRATGPEGIFTVQVQSVNRKYLEISVHLDREFLELENPIRQRVGESIQRGRVQVEVQHEVPAEQHSKVVLNKRLAREYLKAFKDLQREFHLSGQVDLRTLVTAKNVVEVLETHPDKTKIVPLIFRALGDALRKLDAMRAREGKALERDFRQRLALLLRTVQDIRRQVPHTLRRYKEKWVERLQELKSQGDASRIERETAAFADKIDVSEEIVRLQSHIEQFSHILADKEAKGRRLDFLVQEMIREVNTIGSKANDLVVSKKIILLKSEVEKIREQVQNIE